MTGQPENVCPAGQGREERAGCFHMGRCQSPQRRSCGSGRPPGRAERAACSASRWPLAPCRVRGSRAAGCTCTAHAGRHAAPEPMPSRTPEQRTRLVLSTAASSGDPSLRSGTSCVPVACRDLRSAARRVIANTAPQAARTGGTGNMTVSCKCACYHYSRTTVPTRSVDLVTDLGHTLNTHSVRTDWVRTHTNTIKTRRHTGVEARAPEVRCELNITQGQHLLDSVRVPASSKDGRQQLAVKVAEIVSKELPLD